MRSSNWTIAILILSLLIPGCSRMKADKLSKLPASTQAEDVSSIFPNEKDAAYLMIYCDSKTNIFLELIAELNTKNLGSVSSKTTKILAFIPNLEDNSLILKNTNSLSKRISSNKIEFKAQPGQIVSISCDLQGTIDNPEIIIQEESKSTQFNFGKVQSSKGSSVTVPVYTEVVNLLSGAKTRVKRSKKIEKRVSLTNKQSLVVSLEGSVEGYLPLKKLQGELKRAIEETQEESSTQSNTFDQEVELDGKICQNYQVTWYDKITTKTIEFQALKDKGKPIKIEFQIQEGAEVKVEQLSSKMW